MSDSLLITALTASLLRSVIVCSIACLLLPLAGCVTNTVQQVREANTSLASGDSVVVLGRRTRPSASETELDFISCVAKNLGGGADAIRTIPEPEFLDALFPWFEPRTAPANSDDVPGLMQQPALAARLAEIDAFLAQ